MALTSGELLTTEPAPLDPRAKPVMVEMADGARLATDVYLPAPMDVPRPTILVRLPYDKCGRYTFLPEIAARFTAHGFAVVVQDVRGKFRSEGAREPFVNEAADGVSTLDWIVGQEWSDGAVGMMGDSYYGFTQWAAASTAHPALRAMVPRVTGSEFLRMFDPEIVPKIPLYEWVVHTFSIPGMLERPWPALVDGVRYAMPDEAPQVAETLRGLVSGNADGTLLERVFPDGGPAQRLAVPALHMGGWWDNLQRYQLQDWKDAIRSPAGEHQFLRMGASDHEDFRLHEDGEPHVDHEVDDDALHDYLDRMTADPISFFNHYLRGGEGRWHAPRVTYELANHGMWVADRWPPLDCSEFVLSLDASGALESKAGGALVHGSVADESVVTWKHDPSDPVPWLVASEWGQCADLPDEQVLHDRPDVPTFTLPAQSTPYDVLGHVSAELRISSTGPSTHVITRLLDVYPSGRARLILEGATLANTENGPAVASVDLGDTAYRVRPGHSLCLAVSSSCFPLYPVHPGTSAELWQPAESAVTTQTLVSSANSPSTLRVPIRGVLDENQDVVGDCRP